MTWRNRAAGFVRDALAAIKQSGIFGVPLPMPMSCRADWPQVSVPGVAPPILAPFYFATPQPNNAKVGSRAMRRVCAGMQQKQYTVEGWNYACRFRS